MTPEFKNQLMSFLEADPDEIDAAMEANPRDGESPLAPVVTSFASALREITEENEELSVLVKAMLRNHRRRASPASLSSLVAAAIRCAQDFYRTAAGVADALNALPTFAGVVDLCATVPAVDPSGKALTNSPRDKHLDGDYAVQIDGGELRLRCPESLLPYGLLLIYMFDAKDDNRLVAVRALVAFEAAGYWSVRVPLADLDIPHRSTTLQARIVAATNETAGLFDRAAVAALRDHCPDPKAAELLERFLRLFPESGGVQS